MAMDNLSAFKENIFSFTAMLGRTPGGKLLRLPSGSFAALSGLPFAGENYAVFKERATPGEVSDALDFFEWRGSPFIVPQFPDLDRAALDFFASSGLSVKKKYTAMSLEYSKDYRRNMDAEIVCGQMGAIEWGTTVWSGFGGKGSAPQSYLDFAQFLTARWENRPYAMREDGRTIACGMLHKSENAYGVYYFTTVPEKRRKGLARRMMETLAATAFETRSSLVLLSTKEGLPFYLDFGFTPLADIPIYSSSDDI